MNYSKYFLLYLILISCVSTQESNLKKIDITLLGGVREVSGSSFMINTNVEDFIIDYGLFYPETKNKNYNSDKRDTQSKNAELTINPRSISTIVLSHAHLDHIGKVPLLVKKGFSGEIILTPKTAELASIMFESQILEKSNFGIERFIKSKKSDKYHTHMCRGAKKIKEYNLVYVNKFRNDIEWPDQVCKICLSDELEKIESYYKIVEYSSRYKIFKDMYLEFYDAKHIPGSSSILLTYVLNGEEGSIYFSGDVGSGIDNILRGNPDNPKNVDYVFMESTYGGISRDLSENPFLEFYQSINNAVQNDERIWAPSFVLDRTQKFLNQIKVGHGKGFIDEVPDIYILSKTAKKINKMYRKYYNFETGMEDESFNMSADPKKTSYLLDKPSIVITPSYIDDMDFFHPVVESIITDKNSNIFMVGYQDPRSFGGILKGGINKGKKVKLGNKYITVNATTKYLGSAFSGHIDENGIINYLSDMNIKKEVILTHGDYSRMIKLKSRIEDQLSIGCSIPDYTWELNLR